MNSVINDYYSRTRKYIRTHLQLRLFEDSSPIVVASTGRAGSTLLFDAIRKCYISKRYKIDIDSVKGNMLVKLCSDYVDRLPEIEHNRSVVFKTHCQWRPEIGLQAKFIFVHGDPLDSALSVGRMTEKNGRDWFKQHQYHLGATGDFSDLFQKDVLNYEDQIMLWGHANDERILCVAFEDLWKRNNQISAHVDFEVKLPAYRERTKIDKPKHINDELFDRLRKLRFDIPVYRKK